MENSQINKEITLVSLTKDHLDDFYTWASDTEVSQYMTWEAYTCKEDALRFLTDVVEKHPYFKAISYKGEVVGSITLTPGQGNHSCRAELGYVLAKKYWGKGITTEAVKQAIQSGFEELGVHRIEAFVDPDHIASQRVLEKAGMKREALLKNYIIFKGQVKDRYIYSITR